MLRRPVALALALGALPGLAACGDGTKAASEVQTTTPELDLSSALTVAQSSMPLEVPDSTVRILLEDLCTASAGESEDVVAQIEGLPLSDPAQADQVLGALDDGTDELCDGAVDPGVRSDAESAARAIVPTTAATTAPAATSPAGSSSTSGSRGSSGTSGTGTTSGSSGSSSSNSGTGSSGSSNGSSGEATAGGGNANGTGNRSSTGFTQGMGSGSASNSATTG